MTPQFLNRRSFIQTTAWEDNDMRGRSISEQQDIAAALQRRGMQMGVFVAADIAREEPGLTTGDVPGRYEPTTGASSSTFTERALTVSSAWSTASRARTSQARRR